MIKYSVIVPTCHKDLTEMFLENFAKINAPKDEYEVIIVHNAVKEDFTPVIEQYSSQIPNLQYVWEEQAGSTEARHTGVRNSNGEILCFTDDDCLVDKNWLVAIEKTFEDKEVVFAGGNILPKFEETPPKWLEYYWVKNNVGKFMPELSFIDFGDKCMKIPTWFVFGANFIIRKETFLECGGFNPDIYPKEKWEFQGDAETGLSLKLNERGYVTHFNPEIKVEHVTPASRASVEYFKKRGFFQGISDNYSKIREQAGLMPFKYKANENVDKSFVKKPFLLKRKFDKIVLPIFRKMFNKDYKEYLDVKHAYATSRAEGKAFHEKAFKASPELQDWVKKETYL